MNCEHVHGLGAPITVEAYRGLLGKEYVPMQSLEAGVGIFTSSDEDVAGDFTYPREYGEIITDQYNDETGEYEPVEPGDLYHVFVTLMPPALREEMESRGYHIGTLAEATKRAREHKELQAGYKYFNEAFELAPLFAVYAKGVNVEGKKDERLNEEIAILDIQDQPFSEKPSRLTQVDPNARQRLENLADII